MRRLRILTVGNFYPPRHLGGYELVWQAAVRALRGAGHDVRVLCVAGGPEARGSEREQDVHRELRWYWREHEFPPAGLGERLRLERHNAATLDRHMAAQGTELVSWWSMGGMSLSLIERVRRLSLPAIGWVNDDWLIYGPEVDRWTSGWSGVLRPFAPLIERLTSVPARADLDRAARWVFCSEAIRRSALRARPGLMDTAVLHQGVAPEFHAAAEQPWRGRLLYAGRLDERKGLATLISAVAELPGITLDVVGDGDPGVEARLREQVRRLQATVRFWPGVDRAELARRYAACDAVVFPVEWFEPWGLVPLEAMATGRPVIATGRGGSAEYLEHEVNALLFEAGDVAALRAAVRRLVEDADLRARLRAGGLRTAGRLTESRWTGQVVAEHERAAQATAAASVRRPST